MASLQAHGISAFLALKNRIAGRSGRLDVAKERADVESMARMFKPIGPIKCEGVSADGVSAEWIHPPGREPRRAVLFLHGGSFVSGSIASHRTAPRS